MIGMNSRISVFISYSHDSPTHMERVSEFASRLLADGIETVLDQYESPPADGWPRWMEKNIRDSDYVIMICTETYHKRVTGLEKEGTGLGAKWEGSMIYNHLYAWGTVNSKFIAVVIDPADVKFIPTPEQGFTYYIFPEQYEALYRRLTDQPYVKKPALGEIKILPVKETGHGKQEQETGQPQPVQKEGITTSALLRSRYVEHKNHRLIKAIFRHLENLSATESGDLIRIIRNFNYEDLAVAFLARDPDSLAHRNLIEVFAGAIQTGYREGVIAGLFSSNLSKARDAMQEIGKNKIREAVILLAALIIDENTPQGIVEGAKELLGIFGVNSVLPSLTVIGMSSSKRINALIDAIRFTGEQAVPVLLEASRSSNPLLRKGAARIAPFFKDTEKKLEESLYLLKLDPNPGVSQSAAASYRQVKLATGSFAKFEPTSSESFVIIGEGEIGEKAKALAYISDYLQRNKYGDYSLFKVPYSVVIAVSDFDWVVKQSGLSVDDEGIDLGWATEQLKKIPLAQDILDRLVPLLAFDCPLIVRSSSLLEGGKKHSFSGIYQSVFTPSTGDLKKDLGLLKNAIRTVQASVWNENAVQYRFNRGLENSEEKMAVLIQPVIGRSVQSKYYPFASGIAMSRNFYPWKPEIIVESPLIRMVYGLGTRAVGREPACLFSPGHSLLVDMLRTPEEYDTYTQRHYDYINSTDGNVFSEHVQAALSADKQVSLAVQFLKNDQLADLGTFVGSGREPAIFTFKPLLTSKPPNSVGSDLGKTIKKLEQIFEYEITMEFAIDIRREVPTAEFSSSPFGINVVQVRPMEVWESNEHIELPMIHPDRIIVSTNLALGNVHDKTIDHIIYIPRLELNQSLGKQLRRIITRLNMDLRRDKYVLIGPGWWGTSLAGQGIEVTYADISNARAIVEIIDGKPSEPSFGGHLITNLLAESIPLFTVCKTLNHFIDTDWIMKQKCRYNDKHIKVFHIPGALGIAVDGRTREGIIYMNT